MGGEKDGVICLGKVGDVVCAKIAKWCLSQLVSGRGKDENAKYQQRKKRDQRDGLESQRQVTPDFFRSKILVLKPSTDH